MKYVNTFCGPKAEFLNVKADGTYTYQNHVYA